MAFKLSVIIPAYDCLDKVLRCYQSVLATTSREITEVLIQDDASTTYNGPILFPPGVCERNSPNLGFGGNCNAGAKRATGEILFFLNQDCYCTQQAWDRQLLRLFDESPRVGIVGPTLLFPNGNVQSVGGLFDVKGQPFHEALGYSNPDWEPINAPRKMSWVTGAAMAVRHGLWNLLGGFDTVYGRGYFEDVDLAVRAQLYGAEVWHESRVRIYHEVGSSGGNPGGFMRNAAEFKRRYVDTGIVQPDVQAIKERFW